MRADRRRAATRSPRTRAASRRSSAPCPPPCATSSRDDGAGRHAAGRRAHHQRPVDGHGPHERRLRSSSRSSATGGSSRSRPPPRTCRTSAAACAPSRRARCSRRGSTSRSPSSSAGAAPTRRWSQLLRANVRTPDQTVGDIWAQVSANELMERRVLRADGRLRARRARRARRRAVRAVRAGHARRPSGPSPTAPTATRCSTDGIDEPFQFRVALTVAGDAIDGRLHGHVARAAPRHQLRARLHVRHDRVRDPLRAPARACQQRGHVPAGAVPAPEGCLLNPRFPAAVVSRASTGHYVPVLVLGALHQVIPDRVMAGAGSPLWAVTQSGVRATTARPYTNVLFFNGGMGATPARTARACSPGRATSRRRRSRWPSATARSSSTTSGCGRARAARGQLPRRPRPGHPDRERVGARRSSLSFMAERHESRAPGFEGGVDGGLGDVRFNGRRSTTAVSTSSSAATSCWSRTPGAAAMGRRGSATRSYARAIRRSVTSSATAADRPRRP